jgi:hypothetical protein
MGKYGGLSVNHNDEHWHGGNRHGQDEQHPDD